MVVKARLRGLLPTACISWVCSSTQPGCDGGEGGGVR